MKDLKPLLVIINKALDELYKQDSDLLHRRVHERSIVFRFGLYFYNFLKESSYYNNFDLDFDYNRNMKNPKSTKKFSQGAFPDLILHRRKSNEHNILILEFKTYWNENTSEDIMKLKEFTDPQQPYKFHLGVSMILGKRRDRCHFTYVVNGEELGHDLTFWGLSWSAGGLQKG